MTLLTEEEDIQLDLAGVEVIERAPYRTVLEVDTDTTPVEAVVESAMRATRLRDLTVEDPPLEEIVQRIYRELRPGEEP